MVDKYEFTKTYILYTSMYIVHSAYNSDLVGVVRMNGGWVPARARSLSNITKKCQKKKNQRFGNKMKSKMICHRDRYIDSLIQGF